MMITMEDIPIHPEWTRLDILAAVCEHIHDKEKEAEIVKKTAIQQVESRQERLKREKKLKRPMDQVETQTTTKKYYDQQEEYCIVAKKRSFKRTKSKTEEIPPMPQIVKDRINQLEKKVKEVKFIIEKEIYKTDASENHNRISIPTTQIVEKFLTNKEEEYLCTMDSAGKKKNFKKVRVIDPSLDIDELELRRWEMQTSVCYVLNGKWTKMRIRNEIKEGNRIQIWAVRMDDDELIIVLVKLYPNEDEEVTIEVDIEEKEDDDTKNALASTTSTTTKHEHC